jgi:hypothetical protein
MGIPPARKFEGSPDVKPVALCDVQVQLLAAENGVSGAVFGVLSITIYRM